MPFGNGFPPLFGNSVPILFNIVRGAESSAVSDVQVLVGLQGLLNGAVHVRRRSAALPRHRSLRSAHPRQRPIVRTASAPKGARDVCALPPAPAASFPWHNPDTPA